MEQTLVFHWSNFSLPANLMLCFQPPKSNRLAVDQNVVAWKVINARQGASQNVATATYVARYGFAQTVLDRANIITGSTVAEVKAGQSVTLETMNGDPGWTNPKADPALGKLVKAQNRTTSGQIISLGTITGDGYSWNYEPTFLWDRVGPNLSVEAEFTAALECYVNLGYKQNQFIRADIRSDSIYTIPLAKLGSETHFDFIETPQGGYEIVQRPGGLVKQIDAYVAEYMFLLNWEPTVSGEVVNNKFQAVAVACVRAKMRYIESLPSDPRVRNRQIKVTKEDYTKEQLRNILRDIIVNQTVPNEKPGDFFVTDETFNGTPVDIVISDPDPTDGGDIIPLAEVRYSFNLNWIPSVHNHAVHEKFDDVARSSKKEGLAYTQDVPGKGRYRTITVSKKGLSGYQLKKTMTKILGDVTTSGFFVSDEVWSSPAAKRGTDEFIAQESLAWYYAK